MTVFGFSRKYDVTGGPNGIPNIDQFHVFGARIGALNYTAYYYVALVFFMALLFAHVPRRPARARGAPGDRCARTRSPPSDGHAGQPAEAHRFACGAGIAGLAGTIFAAANTAVLASEFDFTSGLLIIVYAMLILGGAGSLGGVIARRARRQVSARAAARPGPRHVGLLHRLICATLVARMRPWRWLGAIIAGTAAFGFVVHAIVSAAWPRGVDGQAAVGGVLGSGLSTLGRSAVQSDD